MQRLDSALDTAQAAAGSGVVSERRAYHKYFPPTTESEAPKATIFLETKVALAPRALNDAAQAKLKAAAEEAGEELTTEDAKSLIISDEQKVEVDEYDLIYEADHWKLVEEIKPESEDAPDSTEQILFEYALGSD
jgi:hypothetical protein